jgi:CubicO group peptidase (beta-lactamase class C family)
MKVKGILLALGALALALATSGPGKARGKPTGAHLPVTGPARPALAGFDKMMLQFLGERHLPGAALAVGRNRRVVYARGFGYADREAKRPVQPQTPFRIASISKPITAVAALQLVERGKLKLKAHVFRLLGLKAPKKGFDPRWRKVTVRQLLEHRGGWDRDKSGDLMFMSPTIVKQLGVKPPAMQAAVIEYMLGRPLDFEPGTPMVYAWHSGSLDGTSTLLVYAWHSGSLDGTSTLLVRRCDGLSWAVLFNSRMATNKQEPADAIDPLLHKAANAVKRWRSPCRPFAERAWPGAWLPAVG